MNFRQQFALLFAPAVQQKDTQTTESSHGGPVYDARIDPVLSPGEIVGSERLQQQRNVHLYDSKTAPASAFSLAYESSPSQTAIQIMGLAQQRDQIERVVSRKDWPPFPGVELGHVPSFANAPRTNPALGGTAHLTHHAHLNGAIDTQQAGKRGRRRFGQ